jgi:hypothetical protein
MFLATLALGASLAHPSSLQDRPAPPPPPPLPAEAEPLKDVDGKILVAGSIPASTSEKARERWQQVLAASLPSGAERAPVTAFDLALDVRYKASTAQTNDMSNARYQWLAPKFVRADTGRGTTHLRGPSGSYLIDSNRGECVKLDIARENLQDRRLLDEESGIAANFARLTDPSSIRIRRLVELSGPPALLPLALQQSAKTLAWIEIESPDFFVMRPGSANSAPVARVSLGVNPIDNRVAQVVVDDAAAALSIGPSTAVLTLSKYKSVDGFQVPHVLFIWLPAMPSAEEPAAPPTWMKTETMSMYVLKASLRAPLTPADFMPPVGATR